MTSCTCEILVRIEVALAALAGAGLAMACAVASICLDPQLLGSRTCVSGRVLANGRGKEWGEVRCGGGVAIF